MNTVLDSVDKAMTMARSLAKKGNTVKAIQIYQAVLARYPKNKRAAVALKKLQKTAPAAAQAATDPTPAEINQFKALLNGKKFEDALALAENLRRKYPRAAVVPNMAGTALIILGRHEEAIKHLEIAVGLQPNNYEIISNLAGAHFEAEEYGAAYGQYTKAINIRPDYAPAYTNRARVCLEALRYEEAIEDAKKSLELEPENQDAEVLLGRAYHKFFMLEESLAVFEDILKRHPKSSAALGGRAAALVSLGRIPDALEAYEHSLDVNPNVVAVHYSISKLKSYSAGDPHIQAMHDLTKNAELDYKDRAQIYFGLANAYEKTGDYKSAFKNLAKGNKARDDHNQYSVTSDEKLFANLKDYFLNHRPEPLTIDPSTTKNRPIFILGMPRSGTTLTEQILASHSQVHGAGELRVMGKEAQKWFNDKRDRPIGAEARTMLKQIRRAYYADSHVSASSLPVVTDKMPMNFLWIGFIIAAIPEARIVHLVRDPMAVCWSSYRQLFSADGLKYAYDLKNLGMYFSLYRDLMAFWHEQYPGKIYDLNYETLTQDQENQTRKLLAACDLQWEDACLEFHSNKRSISTASATQVRKKMYQGSSQAWMKYEDDLVTLRDALEIGAAKSG